METNGRKQIDLQIIIMLFNKLKLYYMCNTYFVLHLLANILPICAH